MRSKCVETLQASIGLLTASVLLVSLYLQYSEGFSPCPLCIMQRACVCVVLSLSAWAWVCRSHSIGLLGLQQVMSAAGLFFASRQLWLQAMPVSDTGVCMPGLELLIRYFPWQRVLQLFFWGSPACTEVTWRVGGISMAAWSALYFVTTLLLTSGLLYCALRQAWREPTR